MGIWDIEKKVRAAKLGNELLVLANEYHKSAEVCLFILKANRTYFSEISKTQLGAFWWFM